MSFVNGSNPFATLIIIGFDFIFFNDIINVSIINDDGTAIKIYCGFNEAICEKLLVTNLGMPTNFLLP
jgi:hypothetical protein